MNTDRAEVGSHSLNLILSYCNGLRRHVAESWIFSFGGTTNMSRVIRIGAGTRDEPRMSRINTDFEQEQAEQWGDFFSRGDAESAEKIENFVAREERQDRKGLQ